MRMFSVALLLAPTLQGSSDETVPWVRPADEVPRVRTVGKATRGGAGLPELHMEGGPVLGLPFGLRVRSAPPATEGLLVLGTRIHPRALPEFGAVLQPAGALVLAPFLTDAEGDSPLLVPHTVVPDLLGLSFAAQAVLFDPEATGGVSFTKGAGFVFGRRDGSLYPIPRVVMTERPRAIAKGDLNGDGWIDIVGVTYPFGAAGLQKGAIELFLGRGGGVFEPSATVQGSDFGQLAVDLADMNGDGWLDVVTIGPRNDVIVLLGDGAGGILAKIPDTTLGLAVGAAVGDLDGDGIPDVAVIGSIGTSFGITLLFGAGDGSFATRVGHAIAFSPYGSIELEDLDGDGNLDVVFEGGSAVQVEYGLGDGTFGARLSLPVASVPDSFAIGDMNGDGRLDVASRHLSGHQVDLFFGLANGEFTPASSAFFSGRPFEQPDDIQLADLTGDGVLDLIGIDYSTLSILPGDGLGGFGAQIDFDGHGSIVDHVTHDVDADGQPDLVLMTDFEDAITAYLGRGAGTFERTEEYERDARSRSIAVVDVTGDQLPEVLLVDEGSHDLLIYPVDAEGAIGDPIEFPTPAGPTDFVLEDLDGDGTRDLVLTCRYANVTAVYRGGKHGEFLPVQTITGFINPFAVIVSDINADQIPDLVVTDTRANDLSLMLGNGDGTFGDATRFAAGDDPNDVVSVDINGDGRFDLITAAQQDDALSILVGRPGGTFAARFERPTVEEPWALATADLDADGFQDVIVNGRGGIGWHRGLTSGRVGLLRMIWSGSQGGGFGLELGDFDGDRELDILALVTNGKSVALFSGLGAGAFADPKFYALPNPSGVSIATGDLNGDLVPDIVVGSAGLVVLRDRLVR